MSSVPSVADLKETMVLSIKIFSFTFIFFGMIGHILNIYILTRPKFRHDPCTRYFLASTLSGLVVVCITFPLRLLQISYNIDVFIYSTALCRFLSYILPCFRCCIEKTILLQ